MCDTAQNRDAPLARFADRYGFDDRKLAGENRDLGDAGYSIEGVRPGFDGQIEAIRIVAMGRFGNILYQLLHAVLLAQQLRVGCIHVFRFPGCPAAPEIEVEGLRFVFGSAASVADVPTLVGYFFHSHAFQSALAAPPSAFVDATIRRYLKPLFRPLLAAAAPVADHTLVLHFRAGDIFTARPAHPWYVQPPAGYYMRAIAFARRELGVSDVRLVFEDRGNPAIAATEAFLAGQGIPFVTQSEDFAADLGCLARARHLAACFSTFDEAAAILSDELQTYIAFRHFESHSHIHCRAPLLLGVLRQRQVRTVLIDDAAGAYIAPLRWDGTPAQLDLLRDYSADHLEIIEGEAACLREAVQSTEVLRSHLVEAGDEATRLRFLLAGAWQAFADMKAAKEAAERDLAAERALVWEVQQSLLITRQSTSWRATAPLRWASRLAGGLRLRA